MTPSPDLLAVLREAREALDEAIGIATDGRNYANEPEARASFGRIVQHLETVRDSALRAHEAQGWDRSRYGYNRLYRAISVAVRPDWESRTLHISVERFEDMMEAREGGANVVLHETPPPPEPQQ